MKGSLPTLAICLALPALGHAGGFSTSARGTTGAQFLELGVGARALAMGEAYSAVVDEATALYWNPAALTQIPGASLTFMHAPYIDSSFFDYLAYARNLKTYGSFGVGLQFFSAGSINTTGASGLDSGTLNPNDMAFSLGYAHTLGNASWGFSGKFIRSTLVNVAQAQALDIGLLSPNLLSDRAKLALSVSNLGSRLKFEQEGEDLPRTLRAGSRFQFSNSFLSSLDAVFPQDNAPYLALGAEYSIPLAAQIKGSVRGGYNTRSTRDLGALSGISMGMGLAFKTLAVDYAFLTMGPLGLTHRVSITLRFGEDGGGAQVRPRKSERPQAMNPRHEPDSLWTDSPPQEPPRREKPAKLRPAPRVKSPKDYIILPPDLKPDPAPKPVKNCAQNGQMRDSGAQDIEKVFSMGSRCD